MCFFYVICDFMVDVFGGWKQVMNIQVGGGLYVQCIVMCQYYDLEYVKYLVFEVVGFEEEDMRV